MIVHVPDEVIEDMGDDPDPAEVADRLATLWLGLNNSMEVVEGVRREQEAVA